MAVSSPKDLLFGFAPKPVNCGFDLTIGNGTVFPEVNFTLPIMDVSAATWPEVLAHYEEMATNILKRAVAMKVPGIVLEFEQLPQMTETPGVGRRDHRPAGAAPEASLREVWLEGRSPHHPG